MSFATADFLCLTADAENAALEQEALDRDFCLACSRRDLPRMRDLVAAGVHVNACFSAFKRTPLMHAAARGDVHVVKFLLNAGANTSAVSHDGEDALMLAVTARAPDAVEALLAGGASPLLSCARGRTALMRACTWAGGSARLEHCARMIRALVAAGANINAEDSRGMTALSMVVQFGNDDLCLVLLELGADPHFHRVRAWSILMNISTAFLYRAVMTRCRRSIVAALALGADADFMYGVTLECLERCSHPASADMDTFRLLLRNGDCEWVRTHRGTSTTLSRAFIERRYDVEYLRMLFDWGFDVDVPLIHRPMLGVFLRILSEIGTTYVVDAPAMRIRAIQCGYLWLQRCSFKLPECQANVAALARVPTSVLVEMLHNSAETWWRRLPILRLRRARRRAVTLPKL